jgi:hypothetical protein
MAGQDRKAGDVIERIKNFFRGFDYSRFQEYPTYALPFDLSELFEAGDKMAGELFEIAKEIDESVTGEKKFSSVRWFDFIQRLIQMDQAENGFYGKVPRSHP